MKKQIFFIFIAFFVVFYSCSSDSSDDSNGDTPSPVDVPEQGETYWWNEAVFYEVFVRSFYDSDGNGKGDFQGLIQKLDYLNDGNPETDTDLGITGIWLMPICQSPSYHGYDVIDYKEIEQDYGTNEDFQEFIEEAHARGIKVIVDYVMNHTSNQHPWFLASAEKDPEFETWYRWSETNPGYSGPWGQPVWHYHSNGEFYYGLFWSGMPDLNYENPAVKDTIMEIAEFWLDEMNVDGFRCDAVKYIDEDGSVLENTPETLEFWEDFRTYYKGIKPDAMAVGEAWDASSEVIEYVENKFDFCFEFDLATAILHAVQYGDPDYISNQMEIMLDLYPYNQYGVFLTNHDQNRVMTQLGNNFEKAKLAATVYLTLPGVPYIYYGEEIGMVGQKPDEDIRRPMQWNSSANAGFTTGSPWRAPYSDYLEKNVEAYQSEPTSIWSLYQRLIKIRTNHPALTKGTFQEITTDDSKVWAFLRYSEGDIVVPVFNFSSSLKSNFSLSLEASNAEQGTYTVTELLSGEELGEIEVDKYGGFTGFNILGTLAARSGYLLYLEKN